MKIWDNVILTSEIDNLSKKGIHKGIEGTVVSINGEICTVWFSNPKNYGEYAFAKIDVNRVERLHEFIKVLALRGNLGVARKSVCHNRYHIIC